MTDIVERLRGPRTEQGGLWPHPNLHDEAADTIEALRAENARLLKWKEDDTAAMRVFERYRELEAKIEALRAENARLREALKPFADEASSVANDLNGGKSNAAPYLITVTLGDLRAARAALGDE